MGHGRPLHARLEGSQCPTGRPGRDRPVYSVLEGIIKNMGLAECLGSLGRPIGVEAPLGASDSMPASRA